MTTKVIEHNQELARRLALLYDKINKTGDETTANKVFELISKAKNREFAVGFCGHFSAGKSSMINVLMGEDLLPSSPIPTSANLVKIKSGDPYARVYFKQSEPVEFAFPYDLENIKDYCADGDAVQSVEISHPVESLDDDVVVMDTPGVDSTDDAHRIATESALHAGDVIFYVMDYNHVQSEVNINFLKMLADQQKRVFLVINQIDKHTKAELDFNVYRDRIESSINDHGIYPEQLFYTTLTDPYHPENELQGLKKRLKQLMADKTEVLAESLNASTQHLVEEHIQWLTEQQEDLREQYEQTLAQVPQEERSQLASSLTDLQHELNQLQERPEALLESVKSSLNKTIDNAVLMPYETREFAKAYIESRQPEFKVGLFFSKKKTEEAREQRLKHFYQSLSQKVETLDWKVKELLVSEAKRFGVKNVDFFRSVYDIEANFGKDLLVETFQEGATANGNYVLKYSDDVIDGIKRLYKQAAMNKFKEAKHLLQQETEGDITLLHEKIDTLREQNEALEKLAALNEQTDSKRELLKGVASGEIELENDAIVEEILIQRASQPVVKATRGNVEIRKPKNKKKKNRPWLENDPLPENHSFKQRLQAAADMVKASAGEIESIKGMKSAANNMKDRARRLEENRFTIALFGAFSAGKSSFANAFIGESVLPVSPNPTTATINQILPPDDSNPHGTVRVNMKTERDMLADISQALQPFGKNIDRMNEIHSIVDRLERADLSPAAKTQLSFLEAVTRGLADTHDLLGDQQTADLETFRDFVANEEKACFVETVELYYDCPLTQQGITLVDTPGADSINARHTGVAFDYIKNADAILFVTYYNHAFSHADREFLIQLGRVKDSFAMDKMFFIVNAADLASSEEELAYVTDYVEDNLISYGIRKPRLYPVSSQMALLGKLQQTGELAPADQSRLRHLTKADGQLPGADTTVARSGMTQFEQEFMRFTVNELTEMAVKAACGDIERAVKTLDSFIESAQEDESVREKKRQDALNAHATITEKIGEVQTGPEQKAINQQADKLVYYVKERVFLRYRDTFKTAFNPSVLSGDQPDRKKALNASLDELLQMIGFDLAQEMRATSLRVENFVSGKLDDIFAKSERIVAAHSEYSLLPFEKPSFETPEFEEGLKNIDKQPFQQTLGLFKNAKHFFEKNGKEAMLEALQEQLQEPVTDYLKQEGVKLKSTYRNAFENEVSALKENTSSQVEEYFNGITAALSLETDLDTMMTAREKLVPATTRIMSS